MNQAAGLRGDRVGQPGVAVPEHADRDAGGHVEVAAPLDVAERAALAARHHHRRLAVVVEEQAAAPLDEIVLLRHRPTLPGTRARARATEQRLARRLGDPPSVSKSGACAMVANAYLGSTMKAAPIIVRTATAVPAHSAHAGRGEGPAARAAPAAAPRKLDAAMELFDHAAVERRYSVEPLARAGQPARRSARSSDLSRHTPSRSGRRWPPRRSAGAGVEAARDRSRHHDVVHGDHDPVARRLPRQRARLPRRRAAAADHRARLRRAARRRWRARTTSWSASPRRACWWWPSSCPA